MLGGGQTKDEIESNIFTNTSMEPLSLKMPVAAAQEVVRPAVITQPQQIKITEDMGTFSFDQELSSREGLLSARTV